MIKVKIKDEELNITDNWIEQIIERFKDKEKELKQLRDKLIMDTLVQGMQGGLPAKKYKNYFKKNG